MTTRAGILSQARSLLGTPYLHGGRTRLGVDCGGWLVLLHAELGLPLGRVPRGYSKLPGPMLMRLLRENLDEVQVPEVAVVAVHWLDRNSEQAQHLGLLSGQGTMLHVYSDQHGFVETTDGRFWKHRRIALFRIRGIE
mgnify:CR=1 FL=1